MGTIRVEAEMLAGPDRAAGVDGGKELLEITQKWLHPLREFGR